MTFKNLYDCLQNAAIAGNICYNKVSWVNFDSAVVTSDVNNFDIKFMDTIGM